jgi:protocatechuate 3,4-dioxygenase alpha subunit
MRSTPSQTVGPYLSIGCTWDEGPVADAGGITVTGVVYDGAGAPINDAMIEAWCPAPAAFTRSHTDADGRYAITMPEAPYWAVHVFARGVLRHLTTRFCFDESAIPDGVPADRRATLQPREGQLDIHLQGDGETVFFDL